jgi:F420H(2)-dependent quinone reductase
MSSHARWVVVNRTANPVVRTVLRSPLHPIASDRVALLTVTGRKSGREYTIPVRYKLQADGETARIVPSWAAQKRWWRNLTGDGAPVRIRIRGQERSAHAVAHGDPESGVVVEVTLDPDAVAATTAA